MAKPFSITGLFNDKSIEQMKDSHKVHYIERDKVLPNPFNKQIYSTNGIEMLSFGIEDKGLLEPIVVIRSDSDENTYYIISGHRRRLAIDQVVERNPELFATIPCIVRKGTINLTRLEALINGDGEEFAEEDELLVDGNFYNRIKDDGELAKEVEYKKRFLQARKKRGETISGKILDLIAADMNLSPKTVKKYDAINRNATDSVKDAFTSGEISTEAAYEISRATPEQQETIISQKDEEEPLTAKKIKVMLSENHERPVVEDFSSDVYIDESRASDIPDGKYPTDNETKEVSPTSDSPTNSKNKTIDENINIESSDAQSNHKLEALANLSCILKKFSRDDFKVTFTEEEISEIKGKLNDIYSYITSI